MAGLRAQLGKREKPKRPEAIIERDDHDALAGELVAQLIRVGAGTVLETPAVDPEHHRQVRTGCFFWRPDVQIQAVLAHRLISGAARAARTHLHAARFESVGLEDAAPGPGRLRWSPPPFPDRGRSERQALVNREVALLNALDESLLRSHRGACRRAVGQRDTDQRPGDSQLYRQPNT